MSKKPRNFAATIPAPLSLQKKVGKGKIPSITIKKCQALLDSNTYDFEPIGQGILDRLQTVLEKASNGSLNNDLAKDKMLECIMQLKANGSMFRYTLVSKLCAIVMDFIETQNELNNHTITVIESLCSSLNTIFENKIIDGKSAKEKKVIKELEQKIKNICLIPLS